ncbi:MULTISPECIES: HupE/UreJ family protein [unclassified Ornithinimicrobium]|uniref:HupE/UreJ family protein n=1 Tax=unclassified Ornithinimicrobium TaxID=2615080 RepID=UPI003853F044
MRSSHRPRLLRPSLSVAALLMWVLLTPATAWAHGIGPASHLNAWGFIPLGIEHMLLGWDHLLFIAGILLVAGTPRAAAKIITVFVLGHSTTLILATLAGWRLNPVLVDVVIGLSIAYVAVAVIQRVRPNRRFTVVILGFGFIHGLGLATRLQDLGLPDEGVLGKVVAFNVGLEIGQLIAISLMVLVSTVVLRLWRGRTREDHAVLTRRLGLGLVAGSALAVTTVLYGGLTEEESPTAAVAAPETAAETTAAPTDTAARVCTEAAMTLEFPGGGGHAEKQFFDPGEDAPMADVGHSLADGHVAFLYRADLPEADVQALRTLVADVPGGVTLAAPVPDQTSAVVAVTAQRTLTCSTVDDAALSSFTTTWLEAQQG